MHLSPDDFEAFHIAVHGTPPFAWQTRLLRQVVERRRWPRVLDLPTGTGKTTCIDIALFALALDANGTAPPWCPRRIAMVVDRRVVVDQAAERGRKLLAALVASTAPPVVAETAARLRGLCSDGVEPLGVFTLRGGIPKDDAWARTPDQPLVIASTVDQIGSRILVQGYGVSRSMRPVHAGLLANDVLLLLDEVHLSQPFAETLDQLDDIRTRFAGDCALPSRFQHVFLSATPGGLNGEPFRLADEEAMPTSPIGPRLHASKPVRLVAAEDRAALESRCAAEALRLVDNHRVVGTVVNRVASAAAIVARVRADVGDRADVVLLTGRMRPLDRDDLLTEVRPRIMAGRSRSADARPLVVVATQCLEAGADFDFDALVTEAASLDALRQRFGRVDRLGQYNRSEGVIVWDDSAKDDPIYGKAITETVRWLRHQQTSKTKTVDFGVMALPAPPGDVVQDLLAPRPHAPVTLPAYLDLWSQTSPEPMVVPDVALWLHGPRSGPSDVQVIWRADVDEVIRESGSGRGVAERIAGVVGAVRPSSLEAMPIPFVAARNWLAKVRSIDIADVEGGQTDDVRFSTGERVIRWHGDESEIIAVSDIAPGDTIVVPTSRGGIADRSFCPEAGEPVPDLAERAALFSRGEAILRLHPRVTPGLGLAVPADDEAAARQRLGVASEHEAGWRQVWMKAIAGGRGRSFVPEQEPWLVLRGTRVPLAALRALSRSDDSIEAGTAFTTEEEDSPHTGRRVPLWEHAAHVEQRARKFATAAGLPPRLADDVALAGWLHDVGKADGRFQVLLRGGSEIAFYADETPWAKSDMSPGAVGARRAAQRASKYPPGTRHEVMSLALLEQRRDVLAQWAGDVDLVLHLIGSHHGYCRPFAPVAVDDQPVEVYVEVPARGLSAAVTLGPLSSSHDMHRLDSPLGDRFCRLAERYGWFTLCWLEALLRLADHRASENEGEASYEA